MIVLDYCGFRCVPLGGAGSYSSFALAIIQRYSSAQDIIIYYNLLIFNHSFGPVYEKSVGMNFSYFAQPA